MLGAQPTAPLDRRFEPDRDRHFEPHEGPRKLRVLIVDDHPAVRLGLTQLLESQPDFDVAVCIDAEGAVAHAAADPVDVVVVDYQLPGRNGLWICRQLKRTPTPPAVVVFSAFADHHLAACAAVAGADGVLNKASLGSELCELIRAVARGRRALPRVPPPVAGTLRRRLDDSQQLLFGMLLAAIPSDEICRSLDISRSELDSRVGAILRTLEDLSSERSRLSRTHGWLAHERAAAGARIARAAH
jgi:DNA-binding NarL/FixJ family response regulator